MVVDSNNLVRLDKSQVKSAANVLARAFQDDPIFAYVFPNASERMDRLPHILRMFVHHGVLYGEVYATSPNLEGITVWLPSEKADMSPWRMVRSGIFSMMLKMIKEGISKKEIGRAWRYTKYATAMHKRLAPFRHWYLQFIGVAPEFQGKGYAGFLLKPMFARMDREHLHCYLATQNQQVVSIYQHYGFRVIEEGTIPGTEITHWAMLR